MKVNPYKAMQTKPEVVAAALDVLAGDLDSPDNVPLLALHEAAEHVRHLGKIKAWWDRHGDFDALEALMREVP